jgi:hypothetical protein
MVTPLYLRFYSIQLCTFLTFLVVGFAATSEAPFTDHIKSLRELSNARINWLHTKSGSELPMHELMVIKGSYFLLKDVYGKELNSPGNHLDIFSYNSGSSQQFDSSSGRLLFERNSAKNGSDRKLKHKTCTPLILKPLYFLAMQDGDPGSNSSIQWPQIFDASYLTAQTTSIISKTVSDGKNGWWVTIPHKTPGFIGANYAFDHHGAFLRVHVEALASCDNNKMVTRIIYFKNDTAISGIYEFTYTLAAPKLTKIRIPVLHSGRLVTPENGEIHESFHQVSLDLDTAVEETDLAIDPIIANELLDVGTGIKFSPE